MYKKTVRRRRIVLLVLVALSIVLLTTHFRESTEGGLHSVQRGLLELFSPLQKGAAVALKPVRDSVDWFGDLFGAQSENKKLKERVANLERQVSSLSTARRENSELRGIVKIREDAGFGQGFRYVGARVIARSPTVWYSTVTINRGSSSGIEKNSPVVSGSGLLGKVSSVAPHAAQVTLITDHTSAVSAQVIPGGAIGVVKPAIGDPRDLVLDFVRKGKSIKSGSIVVTAGWKSDRFESIYPRGIPIGRITDTSGSDFKLYKRANLKLFTDPSSATVVDVWVKK